MKFAMPIAMPVAILAAISSTCAATLNDALLPVLQKLIKSVKVLDTSMDTFSGDFKPALKACDAIIADIHMAQDMVNGIPSINLPTAASYFPSVQSLESLLEALAAAIEFHLIDIQKNGQCQTCRDKFDNIGPGSKNLIGKIFLRFDSPLARDIAQAPMGKINKYLDQIGVMLSEHNCPDAN